jgi:hypothetical protein
MLSTDIPNASRDLDDVSDEFFARRHELEHVTVVATCHAIVEDISDVVVDSVDAVCVRFGRLSLTIRAVS